ncbi:MAG: hypothetical protein AAF532_16470 [Planctomycetota bacterium]
MGSDRFPLPRGPSWDGIDVGRIVRTIRRNMDAATRRYVGGTSHLFQSVLLAVLRSRAGSAAISEGRPVAGLVGRQAWMKRMNRAKEAHRKRAASQMRGDGTALTKYLEQLRSREDNPLDAAIAAEISSEIAQSTKLNPGVVAMIINGGATDEEIHKKTGVNIGHIRRCRNDLYKIAERILQRRDYRDEAP